MFIPYYFFDRILQFGLNFTLDSHHNNHADSKKTNNPTFPEFGIETGYNIKILEDMSVIYAKLKD